VVRERGGIQHSGWPGGGLRHSDKRWIVFTTPAQHLFERLCFMLGEPDLPKDPRFGESRRARHEHGCTPRPGRGLVSRLDSSTRPIEGLKRHDIPHSPIMSMADIFADPHYRARQTIIEVPSKLAAPQPAVIPRLSATPGRVTHAGPPSVSTTDEVLEGLLAMSPEEIAALRAAGVV